MKKGVFLLVVLLVGALFLCAPAMAIPLGFQNITNNNPVDAAIGESQLSVEVTPYASSTNQVLFYFSNVGPSASSITDVYFDNGDLFTFGLILNSTGVSFSPEAAPVNLPGGRTIHFVANQALSADSNSPTQPNGVNPGEDLGIVLVLLAGNDFQNVLDELASGDLRVGIHVQGFASGGSESFVNNPNPVPEPATMLLLGTGLIGLAAFGRKRFSIGA